MTGEKQGILLFLLPTEIITEIFFLCVPLRSGAQVSRNQYRWYDGQGPSWLASVSKGWRRLVISTPLLWTHLRFATRAFETDPSRYTQMMHELFLRSKSLRLHLILKSSIYTSSSQSQCKDLNTFLGPFMTHSSRCESLLLNIPNISVIPASPQLKTLTFWRHCGSTEFVGTPRPTILHLNLHHLSFRDTPDGLFEEVLENLTLPSLSSLTLKDCNLLDLEVYRRFLERSSCSITHLRLEQQDQDPVRLLRNCMSLRTLDIVKPYSDFNLEAVILCLHATSRSADDGSKLLPHLCTLNIEAPSSDIPWRSIPLIYPSIGNANISYEGNSQDSPRAPFDRRNLTVNITVMENYLDEAAIPENDIPALRDIVKRGFRLKVVGAREGYGDASPDFIEVSAQHHQSQAARTS